MPRFDLHAHVVPDGPGDVVVQRGTIHAWSSRTEETGGWRSSSWTATEGGMS